MTIKEIQNSNFAEYILMLIYIFANDAKIRDLLENNKKTNTINSFERLMFYIYNQLNENSEYTQFFTKFNGFNCLNYIFNQSNTQKDLYDAFSKEQKEFQKIYKDFMTKNENLCFLVLKTFVSGEISFSEQNAELIEVKKSIAE